MSSSIENRGASSPRKQRYERLARDEIHHHRHHHHHEQLHSEDDANLVLAAAAAAAARSHSVDDGGIETSSLVGDASNPRNSGIFRTRSKHASWDDEDIHPYNDPADVKGEIILDNSSGNIIKNPSSSLHVMLSRSKSHESSDNNSINSINNNNDPEYSDWEDDDDDDEDEAGIRRYHLETISTNNNNNNTITTIRTDIPLPAEFSHKSVFSSWRCLWQAFLELRTAARQRRAARLLTMPSQSCRYQAHACLLTWCCDATDLGIVLVAVWLSLWLLIGVVAGMGTTWWLMGLTLFGVRISARRFLEFWQRRRRRQRQRLSSTEVAVEFGHVPVPISSGRVGGVGGGGGGFRDSSNNNDNLHVKNSDHRGDFGHSVI